MSEWNLQGKTCFITGATSGIGEETAVALAREGARIGILARSAERGERSRERIVRESGGADVEVVHGDLASLDSIRNAAAEVRERWDEIHVLINNAGVINMSRTTTLDGFENTFGVNHLGPFLFTKLLLDRVLASGPSRIINTASDAHRFAKRGLDLDDLQNEARYSAFRVYGESKLANILFTRSLAKRLEGAATTVNCLHPGAVATGLGQNNGVVSRAITALLKPFFRTPEKGAETAIYLATSGEVQGVSGEYFANLRAVKPSANARDDALAEALWQKSAELVGVEW